MESLATHKYPTTFSESNYIKPKINLIKSKYRISFRNLSYGATEMNIKFFKSKVKTELLDHNDTIDAFREKAVYAGASVVIRPIVCTFVELFL